MCGQCVVPGAVSCTCHNPPSGGWIPQYHALLASPAPPRYEFFQQSPLLGASQYEAEFDYNGTRVFVTTCIVEG